MDHLNSNYIFLMSVEKALHTQHAIHPMPNMIHQVHVVSFQN